MSAPRSTLTAVPEDRYFHYDPLDAPDLEVLVDGVWHPGEPRMRVRNDNGTYTWHVTWQTGEPGSSRRRDTFDADHVRLDTVDRHRQFGRE